MLPLQYITIYRPALLRVERILPRFTVGGVSGNLARRDVERAPIGAGE